MVATSQNRKKSNYLFISYFESFAKFWWNNVYSKKKKTPIKSSENMVGIEGNYEKVVIPKHYLRDCTLMLQTPSQREKEG